MQNATALISTRAFTNVRPENIAMYNSIINGIVVATVSLVVFGSTAVFFAAAFKIYDEFLDTYFIIWIAGIACMIISGIMSWFYFYDGEVQS